jgi:uncharacterized membrane protein YvbJ
MICPHCGNNVEEGEEKCPFCGKDLADTSDSDSKKGADAQGDSYAAGTIRARTSQDVGQSYVFLNLSKNKRKILWIVILSILGLGVMAAVLGIFYFLNLSGNASQVAAIPYFIQRLRLEID